MKNSKGYILLKDKNHPLSSNRGFVLEHRKVWFDHNGKIPDGMVVHHINGDRTDNRIENLEILTCSQHMKKHYAEGNKLRESNGTKQYIELTCAICGTDFIRQKYIHDQSKRDPRATEGHTTCSRKCWAILMNRYRYGKEITPTAMKEQP